MFFLGWVFEKHVKKCLHIHRIKKSPKKYFGFYVALLSFQKKSLGIQISRLSFRSCFYMFLSQLCLISLSSRHKWKFLAKIWLIFQTVIFARRVDTPPHTTVKYKGGLDPWIIAVSNTHFLILKHWFIEE